MPDTSRPLRKLGFLTIGLFDPVDPASGHESTLRIIEFGERLGFDSAWLRHRHLQFGISSPIVITAAAPCHRPWHICREGRWEHSGPMPAD